jgi:hypothetical protein
MKPARAPTEIAVVDEIVEILKRVPKARLRIVRNVTEALAEAGGIGKPVTKRKRMKKKNLLDTPFCGRLSPQTC